jgi:hypothetical protein
VAAAGVPQIIVAQSVVQEPNDRQQLIPMLRQVEQNVGAMPELTTADTGYWNGAQLAALQARQVDVLVPPDRGKDKVTGKLPAKAPMGEIAQQMRRRLEDPEERKRYRKRAGMVEPVFGWIKHNLGYGRFLLRGLKKVRGEWALICTAINLGKLYRYGSADRKWLRQAPTFA